MTSTVDIEKEAINFRKVQLVIAKDIGLIVLTDGHYCDYSSFLGTVVSVSTKDSRVKIGAYERFKKDRFEKLPSNQKIILQND